MRRDVNLRRAVLFDAEQTKRLVTDIAVKGYRDISVRKDKPSGRTMHYRRQMAHQREKRFVATNSTGQLARG